MNARGFWRDVAWAALLATAGTLAWYSLQATLGQAPAARIGVSALGAASLIWLLHGVGAEVGRLLVGLAWLGMTAALAVLDPPLQVWLLAQVSALWLLRCLYRYQHLSSALLDAVLCVLAFGAALAATRHSGSLWLALWSFFLVQALAVFIPARARPTTPGVASDAFTSAQRSAESALRRLARHSGDLS